MRKALLLLSAPALLAITFVTGNTPGSTRNDYTGRVGFRFTVGGTNLSVTQVGRMCFSGNSGSHNVELSNSSGVGLTNGTASVNMSSCTPGAYVYANLPATVVLSASTVYHLSSYENSGGDTWLETHPITITGDAGSVSSAFGGEPGNTFTSVNSNESFVPPNMIYSLPSTRNRAVVVQ